MSDPDPRPTAMTIFCDDIRYEMGNKFSYVGVYQKDLFVPSFPTILPKLCAVVILRRPVEDVDPISFRLLLNDEEIARHDAQEEVASEADADKSIRIARAHFQMTPFAIEGAAILKSRVFVGEHKLKAGRLNIHISPKTLAKMGNQ